MKKYISYIGIMVLGLVFGWIIFGESSNEDTEHNHNEVTESNQMWTCSMHPKIMQPEPGDCPICGMDLIPAQAGADGLSPSEFKLTENAMALANIQTSVVRVDSIEGNIVKLSGKINENEDANVVQASYFSGRIERLSISSVGEEVRKGQLLATIYSPELYAAQQELITSASLKESQPALYEAVRNKLKLWKLSEQKINQIVISGKVLENFPVKASVSGTVTEKMVEQGDYIKQGQPLLKIAKLNTVWANFDVYENQIDLFKKGQEVSITANAYPYKEFGGKVSFIDPVLDTRTRTVKLRVVLNNSNEIFKPGMFVEGRIDANSHGKEPIVSIPSTAVMWTGKRSVVYVKTHSDKPIFEMREVKLGKAMGESYEVLNGLDEGSEIVTNGTFTIDAAAQLQGKKSMMNRGDGKAKTGHEGHIGMDSTSAKVSTDHSKINERIEVSVKFQNQLKTVFENYIILKDALVKDNTKEANKAAEVIVNSLDKIDMKLLSDENAHNHWMRVEREINSLANAITTETEIDKQRNHFKQLSLQLKTAIEIFSINQKVFNQYCPMADNDKGAYWLSNEERVFNPYFGDAMLSCGIIKQVIE